MNHLHTLAYVRGVPNVFEKNPMFSTYAVYILLFVLLFVSYFSLSEQLLIVVKNLGHVLEHYPVKKAAFSLYSRTSS